MPLALSIVVPSFNQGRFLRHTLDSVLDQGYPKCELIVQDGGSTDESGAILERYASRLHHWESKPDRGQTHALNLGFAHATGEVLAYLNSDDLLLPGSLNYVARYLESHPDVDAVYGHRILIDEHGMQIGHWIMPPHDPEALQWADYIPQETLFWRHSLWERVGSRLDEGFRFAMDWDMLLRFQEAHARIVRLPRFLGAFRVHNSQKTRADIADIGHLEMMKLRERSHGRPVSFGEASRQLKPYFVKHLALHYLHKIGLVRY